MKKCIWCNRSELQTNFFNAAHTIPQSLGGKEICENVCDNCNSYFGNHSNGLPSIETIIKEVLNISRHRFMSHQRGKNPPRYTSEYFNINFRTPKMAVKPKYSLRKNFQENIGKQFVKGMYKVFLEENERVNKNSHDEKFNFIRSNVRYNLEPALPLIYFKRSVGMILIADDHIHNPNRTYWLPNLYMIENPYFFEFELFSHVFAIAKSSLYSFGMNDFIQQSFKEKQQFFGDALIVNKWTDIDFTLSVFNSK